MTENYIFDFGRVLVEFDEYAMTAEYVHNETAAEQISKIVFDRAYWNRLDDGSITDEQVLAGIADRVPVEYCDAARAAYLNWHKHLPIISGMPEILRQLKAMGKGLYLLSNISEGFALHYAEVPELKEILGLFDGLVFSGPIRMVKPNAEIFEYLLNQYGLSPETCTFIDDSPKNIAGAKALGINTYLFDGNAEKLRNFLKL
ncbi:MAG: HAD family phosphatase [Clostridia bacterium]|nr:HAD family phosphatase [Clostridia bacterium]